MAEYEFVGFGDIDLILGNLTDFIGGDKQLDRTDFFSAHGNRVSGHFCFMRNNSKFQQIGFKIPNWKAFVCDQRGFGTDEGALCDVVARPLGIARRIWHRTSNSSNSTRDWKLLNLYSKIAHIFLPRRIRFQELHTTHCAISQTILKYKYSESEWIYANGKIIGANNGLEYAYLHFLFLKPGKEEPGNQPWLADFYHVTNPDSDIRINLQGIFNR